MNSPELCRCSGFRDAGSAGSRARLHCKDVGVGVISPDFIGHIESFREVDGWAEAHFTTELHGLDAAAEDCQQVGTLASWRISSGCQSAEGS